MATDPVNNLRAAYLELEQRTTITICTQTRQRKELESTRDEVIRFMDVASVVRYTLL